MAIYRIKLDTPTSYSGGGGEETEKKECDCDGKYLPAVKQETEDGIVYKTTKDTIDFSESIVVGIEAGITEVVVNAGDGDYVSAITPVVVGNKLTLNLTKRAMGTTNAPYMVFGRIYMRYIGWLGNVTEPSWAHKYTNVATVNGVECYLIMHKYYYGQGSYMHAGCTISVAGTTNVSNNIVKSGTTTIVDGEDCELSFYYGNTGILGLELSNHRSDIFIGCYPEFIDESTSTTTISYVTFHWAINKSFLDRGGDMNFYANHHNHGDSKIYGTWTASNKSASNFTSQYLF